MLIIPRNRTETVNSVKLRNLSVSEPTCPCFQGFFFVSKYDLIVHAQAQQFFSLRKPSPSNSDNTNSTVAKSFFYPFFFIFGEQRRVKTPILLALRPVQRSGADTSMSMPPNTFKNYRIHIKLFISSFNIKCRFYNSTLKCHHSCSSSVLHNSFWNHDWVHVLPFTVTIFSNNLPRKHLNSL